MGCGKCIWTAHLKSSDNYFHLDCFLHIKIALAGIQGKKASIWVAPLSKGELQDQILDHPLIVQ